MGERVSAACSGSISVPLLIHGHPLLCSPHHFKHVRISALALLKMVMHARSGRSMEVMGVMQVNDPRPLCWIDS